MEKRKFTTFLLCMLVITSGICLLPKHIDVKADTYTPDIENDGCINLTYIWQMVERVANVVYDADWSQENNIPKGRAWATAGERYTIDQILVPQFENFTQDDFEFQKLPIGPIDIEPYNKRLYSNKIILNDFSLTTTNPSRTIPITELFPMGIGVDWGGNDLNDTYIFENANVVEKNLFSNDNLCEPYFSEYLNISVQSLNSYNDIAGSLKYLNENDAVPRNQDGFVFIMNESEDCRDKFDNITSASGCILIYNPSFGFRYTQSEGKHFSILEVNWDDDNLTEVLSNIKNGSVFFADNLLDTDTLVCTNLSNDTCLPDGIRVAVIRRTAPSQSDQGAYYDFFKLYAWQVIWYINEYILDRTDKGCKGFILSDFTNTHFMTHTVRDWGWFKNYMGFTNRWFLPTFSVDNDTGDFLLDNKDTITVTGSIEQEYKCQTESIPGVVSNNFIGYRNISQDPDYPVAILSNRIDGWWGETPGDSGVGTAILLGIAKYFNDTGITPKYNLRFLFTTGEEYGMRGAYHYNDSHPNDEIKFWIGMDQLGFNYTESDNIINLTIEVKDNEIKSIISAIADEVKYSERTGNGIWVGVPEPNDIGSENYVFWFRPECQPICLGKDNSSIWDGYHRTGENYNEGDSLKHINQSDVNLTTELYWNITKYFTVNPDCWFDDITYETYDSTGGTQHDTLKATYKIKSTLPNDLVMVKAALKSAHMDITYSTETINFTANRSGVEKELIFTIPTNEIKGEYKIEFKLYNSTGRINEIAGIGSNNYNQTVTSPHFYLHRWESFGSNREGDSDETVTNSIKGSDFRKKGYATADNITAYVYGELHPNDQPTYRCMIYEKTDETTGQLIGTTEEIKKTGSTEWTVFSFSNPKPVLYNDVHYMLVIWGKNTTSLDYYTGSEMIGHSLLIPYGTPPNSPPDPIEFDDTSTAVYSLFCSYTPETYLPEITNIFASPDPIGYGGNVSITADVTDNLSGVDYVTVNITYAQHGPPYQNPPPSGNFTMTHTSGNTYQYIFNDTWVIGQYNYTIWATDNSSNTNRSTQHTFNLTMDATTTLQTLHNTYFANDYVNLTDPPGNGGENTNDYFGEDTIPDILNPIITENEQIITVDNRDGLTWIFHKNTGYNEIWHNGTRLINQEQWTLQQHNNEWTPLGTPTQIIVEQPEPYHAIIKRLYSNHQGTDYTVSYEFYGQARTKIKFEGTIGEINNYRLLWKTSGINSNFIEQYNNEYYTKLWDTGERGFVLDYSDVYRTMGDITTVETQHNQDGYTIEQTFNLGLLTPGTITLDPTFGYTTQGGSGLPIGNSIRGSWFTCPTSGVATNIRAYITHTGLGGGSTNGKCAIYRYNADNDATDLIGETNQISLSGTGWMTFTFTNGPTLTAGTKYFLVAWASSSTLIVDNLAYTTETSKGIAKTSATYSSWPDPLTGETGVDHKYSIYCVYNASPIISNPYPTDGASNISRYPALHVYVNDSEGENMNITFSSNASGSWESFGTIIRGSNNEFGYHHIGDTTDTCDDQIRGTWFTCPANSTAYSINVYSHPDPGGNPQQRHYMKAALYYQSNDTKLAETQEHGYWGLLDPDPYPAWLEFIFFPPPTLHAGVEYYVLVWGDSPHTLYTSDLSDFNRSIYVNRTYGSWPTTLTSVNSTTDKTYDIFVKYNTTSTRNGTYYMDNFDMNHAYTPYYWNVSATDGKSTTDSTTYYFRTSGNQSKINNTGTTNITGYLLMQVQFYNTTLSTWVVANDTINETTPRTILVGQQLALDNIFNGLVPTSDLLTEFGSGTYRVYAAFRDPYGDVLVCTDETELAATWEFIIDS